MLPVESPAAQANEHVDHAAHAAHGRQRLLAHKLPHHDGVHRVVELLEQKPQRHGHGKIQKLTPDDALRHVRVCLSESSHCGTAPP